MIVANTSTMKNTILLFFCLTTVEFSGTLLAQEECEYEASDKVAKLLEKAEDKKKYDADKRKEFYLDALEEDENCLPCLMEMGSNSFKSSKHSGSSFNESERLLEKLIEVCSEYHSEPYYFLGAINYANHKYEKALTYFNKFLHFPDDDPSKFEKNYEKLYEEVEGAMPFVEFYKEFYSDEIDIKPRVVTGVSSTGDEYLPMISPDNELMFYTRKYSKKAKGDYVAKLVEEFTMSRREDINADFDEGDPLPAPFNFGDNYGGSTISINNKEMYITKKNPVADNPENFDIYLSHFEKVTDKNGKTNYQWSSLELLGPNVNTPDGWEAQPSLSADGNQLYFATVRPGCISNKQDEPSTDIFMSERQSDGSWGMAQSLGPEINTAGNDKAPFMHSDSKTLYFASTGRLGAGGYDIFFTRMDSSGVWSNPKNIGHPINTDADEHGLIVSTDGAVAYYASKSQRGVGGFDIISFEMPEKARPEKVILLKGEVKDENGEAVQNAKIELKYAQSKKVEEIEVDADDGKYAAIVNVDKGEDVLLTVKGEDIAFNSRLVAKKSDKIQPAVIKLDMKAAEIKAEKPFPINDIFYSTNSADIDPSSMLILDEFAAYLVSTPRLYIEIGGHTDDVGAEENNLALSMDRAFEVKGYLQSHGVEGKRITAKGYGETRPMFPNDNDINRALNRRTEFVVKKM